MPAETNARLPAAFTTQVEGAIETAREERQALILLDRVRIHAIGLCRDQFVLVAERHKILARYLARLQTLELYIVEVLHRVVGGPGDRHVVNRREISNEFQGRQQEATDRLARLRLRFERQDPGRALVALVGKIDVQAEAPQRPVATGAPNRARTHDLTCARQYDS